MAVVIFQQKLEHGSDAYKSVRNAVSFGYLERHYRAVPTINPCWTLLDGFRKELTKICLSSTKKSYCCDE